MCQCAFFLFFFSPPQVGQCVSLPFFPFPLPHEVGQCVSVLFSPSGSSVWQCAVFLNSFFVCVFFFFNLR